MLCALPRFTVVYHGKNKTHTLKRTDLFTRPAFTHLHNMRAWRPLLALCLIASSSGSLLGHQPKPRSRDGRPVPERRNRLPKRLCRMLYIVTAVNPALSVLANEYVTLNSKSNSGTSAPLAATYRTIFYFARCARPASLCVGLLTPSRGKRLQPVCRLKPRLLWVVGSCLRALQQTTVLQLVFDPSIGVGAGLNLLAMACNSRWPSALLLGWACSKPFWLYLHAAPPPTVQVPISLKL
jgi:hypothetical protein